MEHYKNLDLKDIQYYCEIDLIDKVEQWKDVVGYEGFYMVSDLGRVKSLQRINYIGRSLKEKILKSNNSGGYRMIRIYKKGIVKTINAHQLVGVSFLKHIIFGKKLVINHKNFIRTDNRRLNLEIVTFRENTNKKHLKSSSKYVGVSWDKSRKKWQSKIRYKNKTVHLGRFENETDASNAYQNKLKEINGNI